MTEEQLVQVIYRLYEGSTDYPTSTEEDYLLIRGYANDAIRVWSDERNIKWRELFVNLSSAADGDKTTTTDTEYDTPSNFVEPSSYVKVGDLYYEYIQNDKVLTQLRSDSGKRFFYITGNNSTGYKININPAPTAGQTISYSYYKIPTLLTTTSSKPEMLRPYFIVYFVLARLHEQDQRNDLVTFYEDKSQNLLDEMVISNEIAPNFNSFRIDDQNYELYGEGFGF